MAELFFDDFTDPPATNGWVETFDAGSNFQINSVSFPEVMHVQQITGGGGTVEKWVYKDTGIMTSGDIKLEMKLDFQNSNNNISSIMFIRFAEQFVDPANMTGSFIGFTINKTKDGFHQLRGEVSDGATSITTNLGGTQQQHTVWIYANTGFQDVSRVPPAPELLGPYFCTIELKDGEFRISVYNDSAKTIHIRGSPIQVSAGGISPTNLKYLVVAGSKGGGSARRFTGEFDDFRISTDEPLETIPPTGQTSILVEDWESYNVGETAPDGWTFQSAVTPLNGGTFSLEETESEVSDTMPDSQSGGTKTYHIRQKFNKDNITGTVVGRASVGGGIAIPPLVLTPTTPTGGGLNVPSQMEARLNGSIVSSGTGGDPLGTTYAGIAVVYHFIDGAPSTDSIGVAPTGSEKIPHQGLAHVAFKGVNTDSILPPNTIPVYVGEPVNPNVVRFQVIDMEVISEESNLVGNYTTIARNIKRDMNERSASFDSQGFDFDAHVTGITLIPFVITNSGELSGNVETELFADNLILIPPTEVTFSVNAILQAFASNAVIGLNDLSDLVAYWDFDETTGDLINRATDIGSPDSFGTIADGELQVNPSTSVTDIVRGVVSDKPNIGTSYRFFGDGTDNPGSSQDGNEIKVGDDSSAQKALWKFLTDARFTYNAWVEPNSGATSGGYLLFTANNTSFNPGILVFIAPVLSPPDPPVWNLSCTLRKFRTTLASGVMVGKIKSDEKQMITITYDRFASAPQMRFYLNGIERADGSNTGATLGSELPRVTPRIGTNVAPQAGTTYNGLMDEVSVWQRVLQPNEIKQLYCVGIAEKPLAQGKQTGCITIDAFVGIFLGQDKEFSIKAKLTKDGVNEVDSIIDAILIIPIPEFEFTVSSKIIIEGVKEWNINGLIQKQDIEKTFKPDAITFIPPASIICVDSFIKQENTKDFTIDARIRSLINFGVNGILKGTETEDFTVSGELIIGARINLEYTINATLVLTATSLESKIDAILTNRNIAVFSVNKFLSSEATILQVESVF
jgi:hypothetical protein